MAEMKKVLECFHGLKPTLLMMVTQVMFAGISIFYKLAAVAGMDLRVMVAYRFLFGAAFIVPFAFFLERKKRPKLTWKVIVLAFLGGLVGGSLGQNLFLESLILTSATFATAMTNLIPAVTFVIAVCLRLEILGWKTKAGTAKIIGTILGIGGAMFFTFYKGPEIILWKTNVNLLDSVSHHATGQKWQDQNLALGIVLALLSCASYSFWLIIQGKALVFYPCSQSFMALMVFMSAVQSLVFALCVQRDWNQWKLGWDIKLLTVAYAGTVGSGIMFGLIAVCVRMRGPLFVSIFNPLFLVLVAIAGSLVLEETLHLGSVLGSILIICGLYGVLWGKSKEKKKLNQLKPEKSNDVDPNQGQKEQVEITIASSTENDVNNNNTNKNIEEENDRSDQKQ